MFDTAEEVDVGAPGDDSRARLATAPLHVEHDRGLRCDESITVRMDGERVLTVAPESPIVFYVERGCCETGPAVITRCPHINFFCGAGHASRWLADRRDLRGPLLSVPQAIAAAREQFDRAIRLVREGTF